MLPDTDPRHGTTRGHAAGCRETCCREARNADERRRRKHRQVFGARRLVNGTGTVRRIRALWAIGWTSNHIAEACGWRTPQAVTEIAQPATERRGVYATTAETVAAAYERLCMTPGPSDMNRRRAARQGYAPPLAWNDIDNPAERPKGIAADAADEPDPVVVERILAGDWRLTCTPAEKAAVCEEWARRGGSLTELGRLTGWNVWRYRKDVA